MGKPTLLILAAGIGSRYGGLKQVDGMGSGGEAILEYSVFDAIRAGFGKVVFVIRKDIEQAFREKVGKRVEKQIEVDYVYQEFSTGIDWTNDIPHREKPWGTGQAMLAAASVINEPFATVNADDFYGAHAFQTLGDFLANQSSPERFGMVAYQLGKTLSENGSVSRGVCDVSPDGFLDTINERTKIERQGSEIIFTENGEQLLLDEQTPVSMNLWGFHHSVMDEAQSLFHKFVENHRDQPRAEFYIPTIVSHMIETGKMKLQVLNSDSQWYGVTYPEDKDSVQQALAQLAANGSYPNPLWT
ncbi:MAG: nucleotidyltransferase [Saprospiraceae bacterium]